MIYTHRQELYEEHPFLSGKKSTIDRWDLMKLSLLHSIVNSWVEALPTEPEKSLLVMNLTEYHYIEYVKSSKKQIINQIIHLMNRILKYQLPKGRVQMANKQMKKMFNTIHQQSEN